MRKLAWIVVVALLAWFFFIRPGATEFGCEAAAATAHGASDECPSTIETAAGDAVWAANRYDSIKEQSITAGLLYDEDGTEYQLSSGEDSDSDLATELLHDLRIVRAGATLNVTTHVEVKAAAKMRDGDLARGVLVINQPAGVCSGARYGCAQVVPQVLPDGAVLTIWSPKEIASGQPRTFSGG